MNIFYMIFGEKAVHHVQAYLSIRTFQKQLEADDHIYVMTTHPEYYSFWQSSYLLHFLFFFSEPSFLFHSTNPFFSVLFSLHSY